MGDEEWRERLRLDWRKQKHDHRQQWVFMTVLIVVVAAVIIPLGAALFRWGFGL